MNKYISAIILVFTFSFFSCKKNNIATSNNTKILSEITKNDINFKYFSSKAKMDFDDGNTSVSSPLSIKIEKGSQVWTSVTPVLGIEAVRSKMTVDSIFILNRLQKEFSLSSFIFLNQQFGITMDYTILEALLMGDLPLKDLENIKILEQNDALLLSQNIGGLEVNVTIDKTLKRMTKLLIDDKKGNILEAFYSEFILLNTQQFANKITIEIKQPDKKPINAILNHKKATIETEELNMPFSIPANYVEKSYAK